MSSHSTFWGWLRGLLLAWLSVWFGCSRLYWNSARIATTSAKLALFCSYNLHIPNYPSGWTRAENGYPDHLSRERNTISVSDLTNTYFELAQCTPLNPTAQYGADSSEHELHSPWNPFFHLSIKKIGVRAYWTRNYFEAGVKTANRVDTNIVFQPPYQLPRSHTNYYIGKAF